MVEKRIASASGQTTVKKTVSAGAKAAGAEVSGGGPENPVADVTALKGLAGGTKKSKPVPRKSAKVVSWAWSGNKKLLLAEFLLVVVIAGLGTLATPGSVKEEVPKLMVRASALFAIFFIAALFAGAGKRTGQAATALTSLITVAYVFASPESHQLVNFVGAYFATDKKAKK